MALIASAVQSEYRQLAFMFYVLVMFSIQVADMHLGSFLLSESKYNEIVWKIQIVTSVLLLWSFRFILHYKMEKVWSHGDKR